jgi:hypothetical protein
MKPLEDIAITNNDNMGKNPREESYCCGDEEAVQKRTAGPSPKKHIMGKDVATDIPRTLNKDDIAGDLAATEVDKDKSTAKASTNKNDTGKAAAADISNTTPSKEDSVLDPFTVPPNTANMPPSINVSGTIVGITDLPAIASPSNGASTTLTNPQNSCHRLPGDNIVELNDSNHN